MFRKRKNSDFSAEVEAHIRLEADRYRERGMSEEDALATARRAFGNVTASRERFYESGRALWLDAVLRDLRLGVRLLAKTPGWTAVAALTAALGIGAMAAIFSVVNTVLIRPLPFPHSKQLFAVLEPTKFFSDTALAPDYFTIRENLHRASGSGIEEMGAYDGAGVNWSTEDRAERLTAAEVTASFFTTLQTQPLYGRTFRPEEDKPGADRVVVLSYALWKRGFGGDPAMIGQRIRLDRAPAMVIGIMPQSFDFPQGSELWLPIALDEAQQRQRKMMRIVNLIARSSPAATAAAVNQELQGLTSAVTNEYPEVYKQQGLVSSIRFVARPLQDQLTGNLRPTLLVFSGAVGLTMLIVCFTVANLMVARATARRREVAVRMALGAPRRRIVSQLITESLLIACLGGAIGLGMAEAAVSGLNASRQTGLSGMPAVSIDYATAAFAAVMTVLAGVVFGIAPSLGSLGFGVRDALQGESRSASSGAAIRRIRQGLVVAQLGISLTLLIGAGLLAKSFYRLRNTDPGYRPENLLTARINLAGPSYVDLQRQKQFLQDLLDKAKRLPGVDAAAIGPIPPGTYGNLGNFVVENRPLPPIGQAPSITLMDVSPDYFRAMGVPLLEGRALSGADTAEAPLVLVANQAFARKFFPGESPLGHRVSTNPLNEPDRAWAEIVGVAGDIRQTGLDQDATPSLYRTFAQERRPILTRANLLLRASRDPLALKASLEKLVAEMDRDQPVFDVRTMEQRLANSLESRRFDAAITGAFALIAAFLASIGVYGVMSYLVTLRTSEIGIRLALGARREQVFRSILREGMLLALAGGALGIAGAFGLSHYLASLLHGVSTRDPSTFVMATLALLGAAAAACAIPGRRAAGVDPATALRHS